MPTEPEKFEVGLQHDDFSSEEKGAMGLEEAREFVRAWSEEQQKKYGDDYSLECPPNVMFVTAAEARLQISLGDPGTYMVWCSAPSPRSFLFFKWTAAKEETALGVSLKDALKYVEMFYRGETEELLRTLR